MRIILYLKGMQKRRSEVNGVVNYFTQGFSLFNRNINLYIIAALFSTFSFLTQYLYKLPPPLGLITGIISLLITLLSISYMLTVLGLSTL